MEWLGLWIVRLYTLNIIDMSTWISNFTESEQYIINDDGPKNSEENFEDKTPKEKEEDSINDYINDVNEEKSGDIVEDIYGDFELPDYSYDKPSEQISPKINWQEQGWHGKVNSVQEACAKRYAVHTLKFENFQTICKNKTKNIKNAKIYWWQTEN